MVCVLRGGFGERVLDLVDGQAHERRVEPKVRIDLTVFVVVLLGGRHQREVGEQIHGRAVALLGDLLDRRLEPLAEEEDERGVLELVDLPGGQLEVVGLGAGRGEVGDLDEVAAHGLDSLGDREEAGRHLRTRLARVVVPATGTGQQESEHGESSCDPLHQTPSTQRD